MGRAFLRATSLGLGGLALAAAFATTAPAIAQDLASSSLAPIDGSASTDLASVSPEPGAFVWRPELSARGPVKIVVSVPMQQAYVYRGGVLIGVSSVSTGKPGHETPTGVFPILEKAVMHHSNLYDDAAMPFMERLTWDGVALHAGHISGRPASHGCVRLPIKFAKLLYGVTSVGASVTITDDGVPTATPALPAAPAIMSDADVIAEQPALATPSVLRVADHGEPALTETALDGDAN